MGSSSAILAALLAAALPARAAAEGLHLYRIPTTASAATPLTPGAPLRIRAFVADPTSLAASLASAVRSVGADHVTIDLSGYPELEPRAPEGFLRASFLIDFDEPDVRALHAQLAARHGGSPSLEELRRFTGQSIPQKSAMRGWDIASRVAGAGVGDCTEHAVLLTALARAMGRHARVALGLAIVFSDGKPLGLGHAWAEIHEGGHWVPVDATPIADEAERPIYLPLFVVGDEGPGYAVALARQMQRSWVRQIEVASADDD